MTDVVETRTDLADYFGIKRKTLTYTLYKVGIGGQYKTFTIPKKGGGEREINAPTGPLKTILKQVSNVLQAKYDEMDGKRSRSQNISHAFIRNHSIFTNAIIHKNKRFLVKADIKDFFPSLNFGRVVGYFEKNKNFSFSHNASLTFGQLVCYKGSLPQGSPCSPIISNFICQVMDYHLLALAKKYKLDYSRYADDLIFSTNCKEFRNNYDPFINELVEIVNKNGFLLNDKKTKFLYKNSSHKVTGLVINQKMNVDRKYYKKTKAMFWNYITKGECFDGDKKINFNQLSGRIGFLIQAKLYNSNILNEKYDASRRYGGIEKLIYNFIFYKYFVNNKKPIVITEGKSDITFIKAALKNLWNEFPSLVSYNNVNFNFKLSFLQRDSNSQNVKLTTKLISRYLGLCPDGCDTLSNFICSKFKNDKSDINFLYDGLISKSPIIFLFDNEDSKNKPLAKFKGIYSKNDVVLSSIKNNDFACLFKNKIFILTLPKQNDKDTMIEDLLSDKTKNEIYNGKKVCLTNSGNKNTIGKARLSEIVLANYKAHDFSKFKPLLHNIAEIIKATK